MAPFTKPGDGWPSKLSKSHLAQLDDGKKVLLAGREAEGLEVLDIGLRRPTLDDGFLSLTGHAAEKDPDENTDAAEEALR